MQTAQFQDTQHRAALVRHLTGLPALLQDLDVTLTMQAKTGGIGGGGVSPKERNAFHLGASEVLDRYRSLMSLLCNIIDKDLKRFEYVTDLALMVGKVQAHAAWLATLPQCGEWVAELDQYAKDYLSAVDIHLERKRLGRCDCGADLIATDEQKMIYCACGLEWSAQELRDYVRDLAHGEVRPSTEAAALVRKFWGYRISPDLIRTWVNRGKLRPYSEEAGKRMYRLGDIVQTFEEIHGVAA